MRDIEQKSDIGNVIYKNVENFIFASNAFNIICQNYQLKRISSDENEKDEFEEKFKYYQILDCIITIGKFFLYREINLCVHY